MPVIIVTDSPVYHLAEQSHRNPILYWSVCGIMAAARGDPTRYDRGYPEATVVDEPPADRRICRNCDRMQKRLTKQKATAQPT